MDYLDTRDVVLLVIAGYLAIVSLVRLMLRHRGVVAVRLREQIERQRPRKVEQESNNTNKPNRSEAA